MHTTLDRSLGRLAHPLTLAAIGLLLVNDHLLRRLWPSWLTGKLGDVAWLFVAPLALAVVLAALLGRLPIRRPARDRLVFTLAWGSVGVVFTLAKTVPAVHAWVIAAAGGVFGFPVGWWLDPTDLLALPALAFSAWWWLAGDAVPQPAPPRPVSRSARLRSGWVLLPFVALLTVANSPAPDPGIYCLAAGDDGLVAYAGYTAYTSTDGGLSWGPGRPSAGDRPCGDPWGEDGSATLDNPTRPGVRYRYAPGRSIEMSADAGASWQTAYVIRPADEAEVALIQRSLTGYRSWRDGPLDGAVDPVTGNTVFAMGSAGVLVGTADGAWTWAPVGDNRRVQMDAPGDVVRLLAGQLVLALALALLGLSTLSMRLGKGGALPILVILGWLLWPVCVFFFSPDIAYGYGLLFTWLGMAGLGLLLIPATILSILRLTRTARPIAGRVVAVSVAAGLLFLLPFLLWAINALPRYWWAAGFAVVLGMGAIIAVARWARPVQVASE